MGNLYIKDNIEVHFAKIFSTLSNRLKRNKPPNCPNCGRELPALTFTQYILRMPNGGLIEPTY
jgi:hypothetical protein